MMSSVDFFVLGLVGGISPGPMTALMMGETLSNGLKKGIQVPLAIIFSNIVVASMAIPILYLESNIEPLIRFVTYAGGGVLIWMGVNEWRSGNNLKLKQASNPFKKALVLDLLNAHPYLFWFTVLGPQMVLLLKQGEVSEMIKYWAAFVSALVGLKIVIVLIANKLRPFLKGGAINIVNKVLAVILIIFGIKVICSW